MTVTTRTWLTPIDFALLVLVNAIWGINLVAAKVGIGEFPPVFFAALRFAVRNLGTAKQLLNEARVAASDLMGRVIVSPEMALGATLSFEAI